MALNCKPGDLAVIVHSSFGNGGKLVHVKRMLGQYMPRSQQPRWRQLSNCRNCGAPGPLVSDHHNALAAHKCEYCLTPLETTT